MSNFMATEVIKKKRENKELTEFDLKSFIQGYVSNKIPDYQMSAFLMAIFFNGLNNDEMSLLTQIMRDSGFKFDFPHSFCVDKHSTGGVGDKTSIILAPIVAACGVPVPMIGGRGLGHTGGTLDKLESIPGFRCDLTHEEFQTYVKNAGLALIGQTDQICPADKKIYALRDVTGTVESIPLICASIMSKKLAEGISALVLDVKYGSGAFMKTTDQASSLASNLISIGQKNNLKTIALLTNMNQPLGKYIGNALEIKECLDILKNKKNIENDFDFYEDTYKLSLELASQMIFIGKKAQSIEDARSKALHALQSGAAFNVFKEVCENQGHADYNNLPKASFSHKIYSQQEGFLSETNVEKIGLCSLLLGAGRLTKEDQIDPSAGIELHFKIGFKIKKGDLLFTIYSNKESSFQQVENDLLKTLSFSTKAPPPYKLIFKHLN